MAEEWQTPKFRQNVVAKINEVIPKTGIMDPAKDANVMENHIFRKAKSREEYLGLLAKLFIHFREIKQGGRQQPGSSQVPNEMGPSNSNVDPINALQNLAVQGNRNPQLVQQMNQNQNAMGSNSMVGTASNLLQTLTQPRQNAQNQNAPGMRNQNMTGMLGGPMNVGMNANMPNFSPNMGMNNMVGGNSNQGQPISGNLMPNQVQMQNMPQNQQMNMPNRMDMGMNPNQLNQMINRMNNQGINQNQMPQNIGNMNQMDTPINNAQGMNPAIRPTGQPMLSNTNNAMFQGNRPVGQYLRQSPSPASPAGAGINAPQQMQSNSQMIPSPALVPTSSPQMANIMASQRNMRQSPSGPLNTPGQIAGSSPFNPQEDQLYREKYKQLTKYIEPLKRMVEKIQNQNNDVEKITKMNKLLEILCNPHQRIPLETLYKCEKALEKMDFKSYPMPAGYNSSNNALFEAVNSVLQSSVANHTLQRTFRPCLEALFGSDIKTFPTSKQFGGQLNETSSTSEIPHVLQGEIARLDQKFKLSLDSSYQSHSKVIKLICCIDDTKLPCVPPLLVIIPEDYPIVSPSCSLSDNEYPATPFLLTVQNTLIARISKLPRVHSLSHLLDTWEMSIRHACTPKNLASIEAIFCA